MYYHNSINFGVYLTFCEAEVVQDHRHLEATNDQEMRLELWHSLAELLQTADQGFV